MGPVTLITETGIHFPLPLKSLAYSLSPTLKCRGVEEFSTFPCFLMTFCVVSG